MKTLFITLQILTFLAIPLVATAKVPGAGHGIGGGPSLDAAEEVHLLFMRAEEKMAHDVYAALGAQFPDYAVFSNIVDSEAKHAETMVAMIEQFGLTDPNVGDGPGEFSAANYGDYFTTNYTALTSVAAADNPVLQALKNGALIEELDMHDIVYCPEVIVDTEADITDAFGCGMDYTDGRALIRSYGNLLEASKNHLRAFVRVIEAAFPGEYPYQAQYLSQDAVDEILGR